MLTILHRSSDCNLTNCPQGVTRDYLTATARPHLWSTLSSNKSFSKVSHRSLSSWAKPWYIIKIWFLLDCKIIQMNMLQMIRHNGNSRQICLWNNQRNQKALQDDIEGCTPTEARLSTGTPGLLLPFPACRVVGTAHRAAPKAVLFFATVQCEGCSLETCSQQLPQATEFNPGTALPKRWWKTAGQLHDHKGWLSSLSAT